VAGSARGVQLAPVPRGTRPVSDRAREGLFSSLGSAVVEASVLDVFAGTGALGIEALSRGAAEAVFVDRSSQAATAIRDNLERTRLSVNGSVVVSEVGRFLAAGPSDPQASPDLVFLDPPYDLPEDRVSGLLESLHGGWLAPLGGWKVCLTRPARSSTVVVPIGWVVARRLEYGDNVVICYRREE